MAIKVKYAALKRAALGVSLAALATGGAEAAPKAWKPVSKELKDAGWTPKYPPATHEYEVGTVWIARKGGDLERVCGGGVNDYGEQLPRAFRNTPQMAAVNEVKFFDIVQARRELDLGLMAGIAPGAYVKDSPAAAKIALGYKRVRAFSVNYGTVRTHRLTVDYSPGGTGFVDGIRDEECFSSIRGMRDSKSEVAKKLFKSLIIITGAMEADSLEINWELNPQQDSPAAAAEAAGQNGPAPAASQPEAAPAPAPSPADATAQMQETPEDGGGAASPPAGGAAGGTAAPDKKPEKPAAPDATVTDADMSKCGFYANLSGPVVSGVNVGARVQICNRNTLLLAFDEPHYIGYQAKLVTDWIAESGAELTGKRSGFKLRTLRESRLPSISDAEIAQARAEGLIP